MSLNQKPPTVIDGLVIPGITFKVYSLLFFENCVVFVKSGSIATDTAGNMRSALGGYTGAGLVMGAVGSIVDQHSRENRMDNVASVAAYNPGMIAQAHKDNFLLLYQFIDYVEFKGPNFAGEIKLKFSAKGETRKYRIDNQSKSSGAYIRKVFESFLQAKVIDK